MGFGSALLVALADQATKEMVRANVAYGEVVPLTGFFNLVHHHNPGDCPILDDLSSRA